MGLSVFRPGEPLSMRVQLVVKNAGKQQGMVIPVAVRQFFIGREEGCQLRPANELISKRHCAILIAPQGVFVEDFKSTNGTRINGAPIQGRVPVKHGDTLSVGTLDFELQIFATAPAPQTKPGAPAAPVAPKAGSIASPTPLPPTNKTVQSIAGKVGIAPSAPTTPAMPSTQAPAPLAAKPAVPSTPKVEPSAVDDDLAALLMDDDPVSDSKAPIMEAPTVEASTEEAKLSPTPDANQPYAGAPPKPTPAMSSSDSARALLEKLMRRPR